jgi:hypothetical protein
MDVADNDGGHGDVSHGGNGDIYDEHAIKKE